MTTPWISVRDRRCRRGASDESGFVLIYVLMVISIVTVLVGSVLLVTGNTLIPAVQTAYSQAANSAALGGINAFVAYADTNCAGQNSAVSSCSLPTNYSGTQTIYSSGGYTSTYSWVAQKDPQGRYFRVTSTGIANQGGVSGKRIVNADIAGGASMNILDYGVVTGYETQSSASVLALYPQRTIALDAGAIANASGPVKGGQVNWSGSSPGVAAGKVAVCNATFAGSHGRADLPPPKAPNPYVDWSESALNGNKFSDFQPCQVSFSSMTKLLAATNPADGAGGYYSADALLLSNSYPGGSGPLFNQPVTTGFQYSQLDNPPCGTTAGQNYRAFDLLCAGYSVDVGGTPAPASLYPPPQYVSTGPLIPTSTPVIPSTACVYNGPTRVKLNSDGTAVINSPQTTSTWVATNEASQPAQCYVGAGLPGVGMAATISLISPSVVRVISVQNDGTAPPTTPALSHGSSGWNTTGQKHGDTSGTSNSVFYLTSGTAGSTTTSAYVATAADKPYVPAVNDNPSTKSDGSWTPQWTSFSNNNSCSTIPAVTDLKFFNCYVNSGSYDASAYTKLKASVQAAVLASPSSYTTAANLTTLVNNLVKVGNSADAANANPSNYTSASHKWNVSVAQDASTTDGCAPSGPTTGSTTNTPISIPSTDPLYASSAGNSASTPATTTTCFTATVNAQVGTCNVALVPITNICLNLGSYVWGNGTALLGGGASVPQFKVTFTVTTTATTVTVTPSVSAFPSTDDVTQYAMGTSGTYGGNGPGDLYIEGTAANTMGFVAQNDVIITGPLTATSPTTQTTETIAQNNVRVYHPVKCVVTDATLIATTTPGFCPDDLTGLYNTVLPNGSRPDQQYTNMRTDLAGLTINGAVFALGNAPIQFVCPGQPTTTPVCGGEFTVDNYNRGDSTAGGSLGTLTLNGSVAMAHHSPLGEEWEVTDTPGQSTRPYSGYQFTSRYQNLKQALTAVQDVSGVLHTVTTTSSLWHIVSASTASG
jgi:hypothetical protein